MAGRLKVMYSSPTSDRNCRRALISRRMGAAMVSLRLENFRPSKNFSSSLTEREVSSLMLVLLM